jgi:hypothetical protein
MSRTPLSSSFCRCIKSVRKTIKSQKTRKQKEKAAIAICVHSVLQRKGKTLKRFTCKKKPHLITQSMKK